MDTILILILTAMAIGVSAVLIKDRKNGVCASCPYNDSCPTKKDCVSSGGTDR